MNKPNQESRRGSGNTTRAVLSAVYHCIVEHKDVVVVHDQGGQHCEFLAQMIHDCGCRFVDSATISLHRSQCRVSLAAHAEVRAPGSRVAVLTAELYAKLFDNYAGWLVITDA